VKKKPGANIGKGLTWVMASPSQSGNNGPGPGLTPAPLRRIDVTTKACSKCKKEKPLTLEYWYRDRSKPDGLTTVCKYCKNITIQAYQQTEKYKAWRAEFEQSKERKAYNKTRKSSPRMAAYNRRRAQKPTRKAYMKNYLKVYTKTEKFKIGQKDYYHRAPGRKEYYRILARVQWAVLTGKLPRVSTQPCKGCGEQAKHYHHEDYSKPLEVTPLCISCHKKRHMEIENAESV
jgi:hypothetical protein